jgi:hypothetical protein
MMSWLRDVPDSSSTAGSAFNNPVYTLSVEKIDAVQIHPFPKHAVRPQGPFPPEQQGYEPEYGNQAHILAEPKLVREYPAAENEDGSDYALGATAQNNFKPLRYL